MHRLLVALIAALVSAIPAWAQSGVVSGTVIDESGAVVPGAMVVLIGPGDVRSTASGPTGD